MRCQGRRARDSSGDRRDRMGRCWSRDTAPVFPVAGETSSEIWDLAPARPRVLLLTFKLLLVDRYPSLLLNFPPSPDLRKMPDQDVTSNAEPPQTRIPPSLESSPGPIPLRVKVHHAVMRSPPSAASSRASAEPPHSELPPSHWSLQHPVSLLTRRGWERRGRTAER